MGSPTIVLLLDMDNTLLDNDRGTADLKHHLKRDVGHAQVQLYWAIFEQLRTKSA